MPMCSSIARGAGATDEIENTVDYGALCSAIDELCEAERYGLLERFATRLCEVMLAPQPVLAVTVSVRKLRPPVPQHLASSGVTIHRTKD